MQAGRPTIVRAKPTLLRMPPESFSGILRSSPARSTISRASATRSRISLVDLMPASRRGKAMFSSTLIESKRAPLWKSIPTFLRMGPSCRSERFVMFSSPIQTSPESGWMRPMRCLSKTLFPLPERPRTTQVSPRTISKSTP